MAAILGGRVATATPAPTAAAPAAGQRTSIQGPLRVHPTNPRYWTDAGPDGVGAVIYLTGSNTWNNLQDIWDTDPPRAFDYDSYLDFMQRYNHNHIRLWRWEMPKYRYEDLEPFKYSQPHPWPRTGPGTAQDGKPKFDLSRFDSAYFSRLRARTLAAQQRGLYVTIILFEGHAMRGTIYGWETHPLHKDNNVNGIDGDLDGDGRGSEIHTLQSPEVMAVHEAYVRRVIDTVNDLDNVLYEVGNEMGRHTIEWQYYMIELIREIEAAKPKQHPIGMSAPMGDLYDNSALWASSADWIAPRAVPDEPYRDDPPAADGSKIVLMDTDHLGAAAFQNRKWVWMAFLRGHHPSYLDPYDSVELYNPDSAERLRLAMGYTLQLAERIDLANMVPRGELASTGYCLAKTQPTGAQYLVYLPLGGSVDLDLSATQRPLTVEWIAARTNHSTSRGTIQGGGTVHLAAPVSGDAVLYLYDAGIPTTPTPTPSRTPAQPPTATHTATATSTPAATTTVTPTATPTPTHTATIPTTSPIPTNTVTFPPTTVPNTNQTWLPHCLFSWNYSNK